MDDPFHGFFRLDFSSLTDLLYAIQDYHQQLIDDTTKQAVIIKGNVDIRNWTPFDFDFKMLMDIYIY